MRNLFMSLGLLVLAACSGLSARQEALLPAMRLAWPGVETDVRNGLYEAALDQSLESFDSAMKRLELDRLGEGLAEGNPAVIGSVAWSPLEEIGNFGLTQRVSRNEISAGVADSLRERLRNFGEGLTVFLERR